ncbi:MAG: hypothetical protein K5920_07915, partial [Bacteroidales bacterium]|nr:hypothetical protein [Bacteroidales bacterium]
QKFGWLFGRWFFIIFLNHWEMKKFWSLIWMLLLVPGLSWAQHHAAVNRLDNCIDLTDLNAPYIHCTYGTYWDPYSNQGVVPGRHTVMTQQKYDPYTNNQLSVIPPGETYSIRLGDSIPFSQAESIAVDVSIDTNNFDLLFFLVCCRDERYWTHF